MEFDLTNAAPTVLEISDEKRRLNAEILTRSRKYRLANVTHGIALVVIAMAVILGNEVFQGMQWSAQIFLINTLLIFGGAALLVGIGRLDDYWFGVFFSMIVVICVAALALAYFFAFAAISFIAFAAVAFVLSVGFIIFHLRPVANQLSTLKSQSDDLLPADKEACRDIKQWLNEPTIDNYRVQVLQAGREFTRGEVDAMRAFWKSRYARARANAKAAAVEAACKEVYLDSPRGAM